MPQRKGSKLKKKANVRWLGWVAGWFGGSVAWWLGGLAVEWVI